MADTRRGSTIACFEFFSPRFTSFWGSKSVCRIFLVSFHVFVFIFLLCLDYKQWIGLCFSGLLAYLLLFPSSQPAFVFF